MNAAEEFDGMTMTITVPTGNPKLPGEQAYFKIEFAKWAFNDIVERVGKLKSVEDVLEGERMGRWDIIE